MFWLVKCDLFFKKALSICVDEVEYQAPHALPQDLEVTQRCPFLKGNEDAHVVIKRIIIAKEEAPQQTVIHMRLLPDTRQQLFRFPVGEGDVTHVDEVIEFPTNLLIDGKAGVWLQHPVWSISSASHGAKVEKSIRSDSAL